MHAAEGGLGDQDRQRGSEGLQKRAYLLVHQSVTVKITVRFPVVFDSDGERRYGEKVAKAGAFLPLSVAFGAF
jgi:hypothetical protein